MKLNKKELKNVRNIKFVEREIQPVRPHVHYKQSSFSRKVSITSQSSTMIEEYSFEPKLEGLIEFDPHRSKSSTKATSSFFRPTKRNSLDFGCLDYGSYSTT